MNRIFKFSMLLSMASLVAACGGGGGGGGSTSSAAPPPVTSAAVAITAANAASAASAVDNSLVFAAGAGTQAANAPTAAVVSVSGKQFNVVDFSSALLTKISSLKSQLTPTAIGAIINSNSPCAGGGSIDVALDDVDNSGALSSGDSLTLLYNNCVESGTTISGGLSITNFGFTRPSSVAFTSTGKISFSSFAFNDGSTTGTMNGSLDFSVSTADGNLITSTITNASITVVESGATLTLSGYSINQTNNGSTGAFTVSASGTVASSKLGGSVTFTTSAPLQGTGTANPYTGAIKVTGAAASSVTLTALDSTNIRLDVDANGDGVMEPPAIFMTWTTLNTY